MTQKCLLQCLGNPRLAGVMPGLDLSGPVVRPLPKDFQCCNSTGMMLSETDSVSRCDLLRRVQGVQRLLGQFEFIWGRHRLPELFAQSIDLQHLKWIQDYKGVEGSEASAPKKGNCFRGDRSKSSPSLMWSIALASVWRYGIRAHIVTFGKTKHVDYFPTEPKPGDNSKLIYMIENVDKLWTPEKVFEYETLVGWCDRAQVPLWTEFLVEPTKGNISLKVKSSIRAKFSRRISAQKNKAPLDWVQPDCLSRLMGLSEGVGNFRGEIS